MIPTTIASSLPIPSGLKDTLSSPQMPWNLSKPLFERVRSQKENDKRFKTYEVLSTDPEFVFILKYFEHQKPPGYGIKRIVCIHNPDQTESFEAGVKNIEREVDNPIFNPKWSSEPLSEQRAQVIARWKQLTEQFSPLIVNSRADKVLTKVKVLPLWHGSNKIKCESICSSGYTYFGKHHFFSSVALKGDNISTDKGYFGSGIYFTNSAHYAAMYSTEGILLLNWVSMREPYPVVSDVSPAPNEPLKKCSDMRKLEGKEHYQNYNAHYVPVTSTNPKNSKSMEYFPCYKGQHPAWDEFVVFHTSQTLPRFWIELGVDLPKAMPAPVKPLPLPPNTLKQGYPQFDVFPKPIPVSNEINCYATLEGHTARVSALATLANGLLASGSCDQSIKIWDPLKEKCLKTLEGHTNAINALAPFANNLLASSGDLGDKFIRLWDLSQGKCLNTLESHDTKALAPLANDFLASGSIDGIIKVWDLSQGKCLNTLYGHEGWIKALVPFKNNLLVSGAGGGIKVWDLSQGKCIQTLEGLSVYSLSTLANGLLASGFWDKNDKTIKVWDLSQGKYLKRLEGHKGPVCALTQLTNDLLVSGSHDKTIKFWDLTQDKCLKTFEEDECVRALAPLTNGSLASGGNDKTVKLWK